MSDDTMFNRAWERAQRIHERVTRAEVAAYERGLRRGMAIAREHEGYAAGTPCYTDDPTVDWDKAEAQMEREIEEAKR